MTKDAMVLSPAQQLARIPGSFGDAKSVSSRLAYAAEHFHLVAPAPSCPDIPDGCSVVLSTVLIDVANETYPVQGGARGLSKVAIDRIAAAAGISWDPHRSGRLDDGSDPHYCAWRVVGMYPSFDGTRVQIVGHKEMDLRDGSAQIVALNAKHKSGDAEGQVREMRLHIVSHAETKARLRAIRSIGLRSSYSAKDLSKPFIVARLMFTGRTSDPELRRIFAEKRADAMLGATTALFGGAPALQQASSPPMTVAVPRSPALMAPPPVGHTRDADFDDEDEEAAPSSAPSPVDSEPGESAQDAVSTEGVAPTPNFVVPFGKTKGKKPSELANKELEFLSEYYEKAVADESKARFRAKNLADLAAVRIEIQRRREPAPAAPPSDPEMREPGEEG